MSESLPLIRVVVEGITDEAIVRRLFQSTGIRQFDIKVAGGKSRILVKLEGYNQDARFGGSWLVVMDLDRDAGCAPRRVRQLLQEPSDRMALRLAVRASEAWLLADHERMGKFTGIDKSHFPPCPDMEEDPRQSLFDLIGKKHRGSRLRRDMLPVPGSGRRAGPNYVYLLRQFALEHWRPEVAAERSDSLARCIRALEDLKRQSDR